MGKIKKKSRKEQREKKFELWKRMWEYIDTYQKVLVVKCNNISAKIFDDIRMSLRPLGAVLIMGKNTLLKKGIKRKMERPE